MSPRQSLDTLRKHWQALAAREQRLVLLAGCVLALGLLWWLCLGPALASLRSAPARHAAVDQQLLQMQQLQQQAEPLLRASRAPVKDAQALLQSSLSAELGATAQLQWLGTQAQIRLQAAPANALARWLSQVRSNTHAVPAQAQLSRSAGPDGEVRWSGQIALDLPAAADAGQ